jgi:hypothetical protein
MATNENDTLFAKNRRAVQAYLLWREKMNRELEEEAEEPEHINKNYENNLEIASLTYK